MTIKIKTLRTIIIEKLFNCLSKIGFITFFFKTRKFGRKVYTVFVINWKKKDAVLERDFVFSYSAKGKLKLEVLERLRLVIGFKILSLNPKKLFCSLV